MAVPLNLTSQIRALKTHICAPVQDETVILHQTEGAYYGLNATGTLIWRSIETATTVERLVALVTERFEVDPQTATRDVLTLVDDLVRRELAEVVI